MTKRKLLVEVECGDDSCGYCERLGIDFDDAVLCRLFHKTVRRQSFAADYVRLHECLEAERAARAADNAAYWQKKYEDLEVRRASCCEATEREAKSLAAQLDSLVRAARRVVEAASWCRDEFPGAGSMFPLIDALDAIDRAAKAKDGE